MGPAQCPGAAQADLIGGAVKRGSALSAKMRLFASDRLMPDLDGTRQEKISRQQRIARRGKILEYREMVERKWPTLLVSAEERVFVVVALSGHLVAQRKRSSPFPTLPFLDESLTLKSEAPP